MLKNEHKVEGHKCRTLLHSLSYSLFILIILRVPDLTAIIALTEIIGPPEVGAPLAVCGKVDEDKPCRTQSYLHQAILSVISN